MKRILITLTALFLLVSAAQAQEQTLIGGDARLGGFGGTGTYYTDYMGEATALVGIQGALVVNRTMYIGLAGYGFGRQPDAGMEYVEGAWHGTRFEGGYGGLLLGGMIYSDRVVHGTADVLIGGGGITRVVRDWEHHEHDDFYGEERTDGFFAVQPMVHAELNVVRWMRVDLGAGYRFVSDVEDFGLENEDVNGPVAGIGFRFGRF